MVTDTKIFRYGFESRSLKKITETEGFIRSAAFDSKMGFLACGTEDKKIVIVDTNKEEVIKKILCPTFVNSLTFSSNRATLAAGCFGTIVLINTKTWETSEIPIGDFCPSAMVFRNDSLLACYFYRNSEFILENITNRKVIKDFREGVLSFAFSKDGKLFAVGKNAGEVEIVDTETGLTKTNLKVKEPSSLKFLNQNLLACGTFEGNLFVFNLENNGLILKLSAHIGFVSSIDFSSDGNYLLSAGNDGTVIKYDLTSQTLNESKSRKDKS
jgi:WD40 repeat protein